MHNLFAAAAASDIFARLFNDQSVYWSDTSGHVTFKVVMLCICCSIVLGFLVSLLYMFTNRKKGYAQSLVIAFPMLAGLVCTVIIMMCLLVDSSDGTKAAITLTGAFSLTRFRSAPVMGLGLGFRVNHCMADSGSVVITPDGSLYPCEHCAPESRYGDVFNGTTDEAAEREFRRADRTREMCRKCSMLPVCTSYAACPWVDAHCRESHDLHILVAVKRLIDRNGTQTNETDEDEAFC